MSYEYKVVPAPVRGKKAKGVKTAQDRFAHALETAMNELAAEGWEYLRADTLPCEQREGLMSKTTVYQNMLVFRRTAQSAASDKPVETFTAAPRPKKVAPPPMVEKKLIASQKEDPPAPEKKPGSSPDVAAE